MDTFTSKVINALLSGHGGPCNHDKCNSISSKKVTAGNWTDCTKCWTSVMRRPDVSEVENAGKQDLDLDIAEALGFEPCTEHVDEFTTESMGQLANVMPAAFADVIDDGSCAAPCLELARPLCAKGNCVQLNCADAAKHCHLVSQAGKIARQFCPETCGCHDITSRVLQGCPLSSCERKHRSQLATLPCTDAPPGDPKLKAYANEYLRYYNSSTRYRLMVPFAQGLVARGCEVAREYARKGSGPDNTCAHPPGAIPKQFKPLEVFCPVACFCTNKTKQNGLAGCPEACARESKEIKDSVAG